MANNVCPQCGAPIDPGAQECKFCGEKFVTQQAAGNVQTQSAQPQSAPQTQVIIQQTPATGINPAWPVKSKTAAGVLALLLGGIGIHKFYLGKVGMGIVYILFCWTGIPAILGLIEGIVYLCSSDENFQLKNHVRIE